MGVALLRDASEGTRIPVTLDQIAPLAVQATIAAEDQRFWNHPGVDPLAVARALADGATDVVAAARRVDAHTAARAARLPRRRRRSPRCSARPAKR